VFENKMLMRIFGPKDEVTGELRRIHNEELHGLYSSPHIIPVIKSRITRRQGMWPVWETEEVHRGFWCVDLSERTTWKTQASWEDNIKIDVQAVGRDAWTGLIWLRIGTGGRLL
jgi:hypothetical protein